MDNNQKATIKYFGYGTNRDHEMMAHMVGRGKIEGESAKLLDYELCIQELGDISDEIISGAPAPMSPRYIVKNAFDGSFELYIIRPKAGAETYGTIWQLTPEELKLVHEWELLEFGMQKEINSIAVDAGGNSVPVETHGSLDPHAAINRVVTGKDYEDYIVPKDRILQVADRVRKEYLERMGKN